MNEPRPRHDIAVRAAKLADIDHVLRLWQESRGGLGKTDERDALEQLLQRDHGALLLAVGDQLIVGTLIATWDGWRANMYRLTVHPSCQRQGIASQLIGAGDAALRRRGARRVTALVWEDDSRAVTVWQKAGYELDEGTGRFVKTLTP